MLQTSRDHSIPSWEGFLWKDIHYSCLLVDFGYGTRSWMNVSMLIILHCYNPLLSTMHAPSASLSVDSSSIDEVVVFHKLWRNTTDIEYLYASLQEEGHNWGMESERVMVYEHHTGITTLNSILASNTIATSLSMTTWFVRGPQCMPTEKHIKEKKRSCGLRRPDSK